MKLLKHTRDLEVSEVVFYIDIVVCMSVGRVLNIKFCTHFLKKNIKHDS